MKTKILIGSVSLLLILVIMYYVLKKPKIEFTEQTDDTGIKQYLLSYNYKHFEHFPYEYIYVNPNELQKNLISVLVSATTFEQMKQENKFNLIAA